MSKSKKREDQVSFPLNDGKDISAEGNGDLYEAYVNEEHFETAHQNPPREGSHEPEPIRDRDDALNLREPPPENIEPEVPNDYNLAPKKLDDTPEVKHEEPAVITVINNNKRHIDFDYRNSFIISLILSISQAISKKFRNSMTVKLFTSFLPTAERFRSTKLYSLCINDTNGEKAVSLQKRIRASASDAKVPTLFSKLSSLLLRINLRVYGFLIQDLRQ